MIGRIHLRDDFRRLRREGRTVRRGHLSLVHYPTGSSVRFAYAIPRIVGPAVVRNRVRRRLRAILGEMDRKPEGIVPGDYLVRVSQGVATSSYTELERWLSDAINAVANQPQSPPKK